MAAVTTVIAAIGVAASIAGTVVGFQAANQQAAAQKRAAQAQAKAEEERKKAMNLDAFRKQKAMIREAQLAQATALSTAGAQGAESGSGLQGAYGGIWGQTQSNMQGVEQNREIGNRMFDYNIQAYQANAQAAAAGGRAALGAGITTLGGMLTQNAGTIGRIGTYFGQRKS
jgi:hypothetical protein